MPKKNADDNLPEKKTRREDGREGRTVTGKGPEPTAEEAARGRKRDA